MDIAFILVSVLFFLLLAVYAYRKNPIQFNDLLSVWSFSTALGLTVYLWGYWSGYWDLSAPSLGRLWTLLFTWCIGHPACKIAFICLLQKSSIANIALAISFAILKTLLEYITVYIVYIGQYGNGWHIGLTFWSYFIPLLIVWGYYRLILFAKRI